MPDNHVLIAGSSYWVGDILCRQPTLGDIYRDKDVGHEIYQAYLYVIGMTVDRFLDAEGLRDGFASLSAEEQAQIDILGLLTHQSAWRSLLLDALDFFVDGSPRFDAATGRIVIERDGGSPVLLTGDAYAALRKEIMQCACLKAEDDKPKGFYNNAAKRLYEKSLALKQKRAKANAKSDADYEIWNVIGAVSARHPSYNLLNIWGLTVFQLYDQFSRIHGGIQLDGMIHKWAAWGTAQFDFSAWFKKEPSGSNH